MKPLAYKVDLQRIREALPNHAKVVLQKKLINGKTVCFIECFVRFPSLSQEDFEMCKQWQRTILVDVFDEFYTEETGNHWIIYLKRVNIEFTSLTDEDLKGLTGLDIKDLLK
jgi:hypothetical protein